MSLRDRLLEIRVNVSPRRINEAIHPTLSDSNSVFEVLPEEVKERFETRCGDSKIGMKNRFLKALGDLLRDGFTLSQIIQIDDVCIDNKGRIDRERLVDIINGKYDD
ncbi:MAG: hypothetical protein QY322_01145 [bacterium]|nr:MAG: hypothetical protein QY322_01145 [bacterium]